MQYLFELALGFVSERFASVPDPEEHAFVSPSLEFQATTTKRNFSRAATRSQLDFSLVLGLIARILPSASCAFAITDSTSRRATSQL
ncbi:MAG: hypothetical protein WA823_04605 [Candidatus Acidiferrales bacterium]